MIFLDSSFIIASKIEYEEDHNKAIEILNNMIENNESTVLSDYVFDEVVTVLFGKTKNLEFTNEVGNMLRSSATFINVDDEMFDNAWGIFQEQKDAKLSFTDCSIIALMKKEGINKIATFDKDFKKVKGIKIID